MAMLTVSSNLPGQGKGETILAMSFKPFITSIGITTATNKIIRRRTRLLNGYQQRKTDLPRFRYVALGLEEDICIESIVGYNAERKVVYEGTTGECESDQHGVS